jgi:hypothetical protein
MNKKSIFSIGHRIDRWVLKKGLKHGWPLPALWLIETRRKMLSFNAKNQAGSQFLRSTSIDKSVPHSEGYRLFSSTTFPELQKIIVVCQYIFDRHKPELKDETGHNKPYFFNILTADDLRHNPLLMSFALSQSVVDAVRGYLGQNIRLHSIGLFYSAVNDSVAGSQMYHVDGDALSQIKCFVNVWDVDLGGGAFTFLPKQYGSISVRNRGLLKSISDQEAGDILPVTQQIKVVGSAGSGVFVDTSRCLHQGSRTRIRPRLVFQFQYVTWPDALLSRPDRCVKGGHLLVNRQLIEEIGLGASRLGELVN